MSYLTRGKTKKYVKPAPTTPKSTPTDFTALDTACLNCCCTALPAGFCVITFLVTVGFVTAFGAVVTVGLTVLIILGAFGLGFFWCWCFWWCWCRLYIFFSFTPSKIAHSGSPPKPFVTSVRGAFAKIRISRIFCIVCGNTINDNASAIIKNTA